MKLLIISTLFVFFSIVSYSQIKPNVFDEKGNLIERNRVDENGKYITSSDENFVVQQVFKYDINNKLIEESNLNIDKKLVQEGISTRKYKYKNGLKIEDSFYNYKGELQENFLGFAIVRYKFNEKGLEIERAFLDKEKKHVGDKEYGVSIILSKYDSNSRLIERRHLGAKKELVKPYSSGSIIQISYNKDGEVSEVKEFDINEKLIKILNESTNEFLKIDFVSGFAKKYEWRISFYNITNGIDDVGMFTFKIWCKNSSIEGESTFEVVLNEKGEVTDYKLISSTLKKKTIKPYFDIFSAMRFHAKKFNFKDGMKGRVVFVLKK